MLGNFDARDRSGDDRQLQKLTTRRGDRCAGNTERRNGAIAKDQNEIEYQVQYVGQHHRHDHRTGDVMRLQIRADHEERQPRRDTDSPKAEIGRRRRDNFRFDANRVKEKGSAKKDERQPGGGDERQPDALPHHTSRTHVIASADRLRDQRIDAEHQSESEDGDAEVDRVAQSDQPAAIQAVTRE